MHKIWHEYDPIKAFAGIWGFCLTLAFIIHFILLSSTRYSWIENGTLSKDKAPVGISAAPASSELAPLPPNR
jgi:light-harvesting complex 1 alpha chain